jgi:hypothetical protein
MRWTFARLGLAAIAAATMAALVPATAAAHQLTGRYESPLPLWAYLVGAAVAVGLSFAFVLLRPVTVPAAAASDETAPGGGRRPGAFAGAGFGVAGSAAAGSGARRDVPAWLRVTLRLAGVAGWLWILVQTLVATDPAGADVASLFLWVYGWVGLALLSAFLGPVWRWLDPFTTLHDAGAALLRRFGVGGWRAAAYPGRLASWPAVAGFAVFVWLELVLPATRSGRPLGIALLLYTAWTLLMMSQFGRDPWRSRGEVFSVWFATLGRLAAFAAAEDREGEVTTVRRQRLPRGLIHAEWDTSRLLLVAVATGAILFDGLSQTQAWFDLFGAPDMARETVLLAAWLGIVCLAVLLVARPVGHVALGAGLLPIAVGYLIAHYLTYLIGDGQRIVVAISDPLGNGWDLIGFAQYDPTVAFLPAGLVWAAQIVAVVGGHVVGAWAGHDAAIAQTLAAEPGLRPGERVPSADVRRIRAQQIPLAVLMIGLTALTLWSLGQAIVKMPEEAADRYPAAAAAADPSVAAAAAAAATAGDRDSSHSPSGRTSASRPVTRGSRASAAATAVSIAVRQRIPSAVAA